jgi:predicted GH43/DUF377 family glycosyl hydrolase
MIRWDKRGRIFVPDGSMPWMKTHAAVPVADRIEDDALRILFAGRDEANRSRIGWIDVDSLDPGTILGVSDEPLLELGERGTFDDSGVMPSCVVSCGSLRYLYYIGWNTRVAVPYHVSIGLAISRDGGRTFRRYSAGPLLDRDKDDPFFVSNPCVLREGDLWRMWYISCTGWDEANGHPEPMYYVKYAESDDGLSWRRAEVVCIDYDAFTRAIGRPWVVDFGDRYGMWFSYRGLRDYRTDPVASYRVGYAESPDGLAWERRPDAAGLERSESGWDSVMVAYTNVVHMAGRLLCFYNGNGFGRSGFGYAIGIDEGSETKGAGA